MEIPKHYPQLSPQGIVPGPAITLSTKIILEAANELGVSFQILPGTKIIELNYQGSIKYFRLQISTETTDIGFFATNDKSVTLALLANQGLMVPKGFRLSRNDSRAYLGTIFEALTKPLVIKPTHGSKGNGITLGVTTLTEFEIAVEKAFNLITLEDAGVIVEEVFNGAEYRVLATREKVVGIINRRPANVTGNGLHSIRQLIDIKNSDPKRGDDDTYVLSTIQIDDDVKQTLSSQGLSLEYVPPPNQLVFLRRVSNISKGGDSIDVTELAHPSVSEIAIEAINSIPGLGYAGIDFMTNNIQAPQTEETYRIIEINNSPSYCIHEYPVSGKPRRSQYEFLYLAFPQLRPISKV